MDHSHLLVSFMAAFLYHFPAADEPDFAEIANVHSDTYSRGTTEGDSVRLSNANYNLGFPVKYQEEAEPAADLDTVSPAAAVIAPETYLEDYTNVRVSAPIYSLMEEEAASYTRYSTRSWTSA